MIRVLLLAAIVAVTDAGFDRPLKDCSEYSDIPSVKVEWWDGRPYIFQRMENKTRMKGKYISTNDPLWCKLVVVRNSLVSFRKPKQDFNQKK